ncbi:S1 RNA-binding domain-containing protein [Caldibacillus debilis]|uniref:Ribosomal protein S1 n=1 Tax=Caldibacillus debilis GB1 TaxID=1339248 RepID=A0A420VE70_9BACI|nr:S1 RNA-binding domain-containing protein [Caldibacillus debilis]RKO61835.1 Ribosomal protein S1 [Caldibacillus debilis GB1]
MKTLEDYRKLMETGQEFKELVRLTQHDEITGEDILLLNSDSKISVICPRSEVEMFDYRGTLTTFVGKRYVFAVKEIDEANNRVICSRKMVLKNRFDELVYRMEQGETIHAKIVKFIPFGAYLRYKGVSMLLQNRDFSEDLERVQDVHKIGDTIEVKLRRVTRGPGGGRLIVEAVHKHKLDSVFTLDDFEPNQVTLGEIRGIKPFGVFVKIAPGLDALCPIPDFEIEMNQRVLFRITQVNKEKGRVRGKIVRLVNDLENEEDEDF